jgi:peptidoglycan hydrolase-like protein with peptidoglycan-binding domain
MTRSRKQTVAVLGGIVIGAVALVVLVGAAPRSGTDSDTAVAMSDAQGAETVAVTRRTLTETETIDGTVGHGSAVPLPIEARGIVTWAPEQDDVLSGGDVAVEIDARPLTLVAGNVPLYRELRKVGSRERDVAGDKLGLQTGPDVTQLQRYLIGAGFDDDDRLEIGDTFDASTERAVKAWQEAVGHPATGRVDRTQMIFVNGEVRVEEVPIVGQPFSQITVTTPSQTITAAAKAAQRTFFTAGTTVEIDANGQLLTGTVTEVSRTTGPEGTTRYELEITVDDGALPEGVESVDVTATKTIAVDVLTVPVRALLALAEGGWAVEIPTDTGTELVRVELGVVVEGTAEISGVAEGTRVVVPS